MSKWIKLISFVLLIIKFEIIMSQKFFLAVNGIGLLLIAYFSFKSPTVNGSTNGSLYKGIVVNALATNDTLTEGQKSGNFGFIVNYSWEVAKKNANIKRIEIAVPTKSGSELKLVFDGTNGPDKFRGIKEIDGITSSRKARILDSAGLK